MPVTTSWDLHATAIIIQTMIRMEMILRVMKIPIICIQQYGVAFYYVDTLYEAEFTDDGPTLTNRTTGEIQGPFDSTVQLLENAEINGRKMIRIIDQLDHVVLH